MLNKHYVIYKYTYIQYIQYICNMDNYGWHGLCGGVPQSNWWSSERCNLLQIKIT